MRPISRQTAPSVTTPEGRKAAGRFARRAAVGRTQAGGEPAHILACGPPTARTITAKIGRHCAAVAGAEDAAPAATVSALAAA